MTIDVVDRTVDGAPQSTDARDTSPDGGAPEPIEMPPLTRGGAAGGKERRERLAPMVHAARRLLQYAAASAVKLDDGIRNTLVETAERIAMGESTFVDEQAFHKAYEGLAAATAPVTAETLEASENRLPGYNLKALLRPARANFTLGRYVNVAIFVAALTGTCVALSYYSQGWTALQRYYALSELISKQRDDLRVKEAAEVAAKQAVLDLEARKTDGTAAGAQAASEAIAVAKKNYRQADEASAALIVTLREEADERLAIPHRLTTWASLPCAPEANFVMQAFLCATSDRTLLAQVNASTTLSDTERIALAETVASRLSQVYLPLLFGWLGAHAFILRRMIQQIAARTFTRASSLEHIVRVGLGALAGFVSVWMLTPDVVGGPQLQHLPAWGLAFIAGYGIELVFAFMDRLIAAFTSKAA